MSIFIRWCTFEFIPSSFHIFIDRNHFLKGTLWSFIWFKSKLTEDLRSAISNFIFEAVSSNSEKCDTTQIVHIVEKANRRKEWRSGVIFSGEYVLLRMPNILCVFINLIESFTAKKLISIKQLLSYAIIYLNMAINKLVRRILTKIIWAASRTCVEIDHPASRFAMKIEYVINWCNANLTYHRDQIAHCQTVRTWDNILDKQSGEIYFVHRKKYQFVHSEIDPHWNSTPSIERQLRIQS